MVAVCMVSCNSVESTAGAQAVAVPEVHWLNVSREGSIEVSATEGLRHFAFDGDIDTWWSADDFAPQWLEISFGGLQLVEKIELIVSQVRPGPAKHKIRLERAGQVVAWHRFDVDLAVDGKVFSLRLDPALQIDKVRILTTRHEGWVAWREVRILSRSAKPVLATYLSNPIYLTHAGDGSGRLFVIEKEGRIRIVRDNVLVETPFLDISGRVSAVHERGLLGVAFPPSYATRGRFYVNYTDTNGDTVISRFGTSVNPEMADPGSEEVILTFKQNNAGHNGGTLKFGPRDGYLYVASGDGGTTDMSEGFRYSQQPGSLLGKILRIDVESGEDPYAIPPDNPYVSTPGYAPEIWALGLRNPWGIGFDEETGALFIPDPGWETSEEINFQPAASPGGENYGWPYWEGHFRTEGVEGIVKEAVWPVGVYGREGGCAIVGGAVHQGAFIYSDFCTGKVWSLRRQGEGGWESIYLLSIGRPVSSIGADEAGNVYATGFADGNIYLLLSAPPPGGLQGKQE